MKPFRLSGCLFTRSVWLLILLLSASCRNEPTPYAAHAFGVGGYDTVKIDETTYRIEVDVNRNTSPAIGRKFAMLRAAELGRDQGFAAFRVIAGSGQRTVREVHYLLTDKRVRSYDGSVTWIEVAYIRDAEKLAAASKRVWTCESLQDVVIAGYMLDGVFPVEDVIGTFEPNSSWRNC